jgi:hypothetical protein
VLLAHPGLHLKMVFEGLQNVDRRLRGLPGVLAVAPLSVAGVLCSTRLVANELRGFCALVALVPYPCRDRLTAAMKVAAMRAAARKIRQSGTGE